MSDSLGHGEPHDAGKADRRSWLSAAGRSALATAMGGALLGQPLASVHAQPAMQESAEPMLKGRIRHSVVHWCFQPMTVEQLAIEAKELGIQSVELVSPEHWPMLRKHGLTCAIASSHGFAKGWNHRENWDFCRDSMERAIDASADFGCPNVITFSGMLDGIDPDEGVRNTIEGLKTVVAKAENRDVTLCLEVLNSRVDENMKGHPGYQCDTLEWALHVCETIGSPRLKILYDIYHQQIMQGDQISRIRAHHQWIGHYHTAGVPGRRELDDAQEIHYPAIMRAIAETGYEGFVGHEFIPTWDDPIAALRHAVQTCDV